MLRIVSKSGLALAAIALGITASHASSVTKTAKEVTLASPDQAMTFCQSGKMPAADIAYIAGAPGLAQFGPASSCVQQVPTKKTTVTKSIQVVGTKVSECKMEGTKPAIQFCQGGSMGEWDIDYISGKVGKTISGPGYGCVVNYSTSSIGNAVCK